VTDPNMSGVSEEILDATIADPNVAAPVLQVLSEKPYNEREFRDQARKRITYWMLALLSVLFVGSFVSLWFLSAAPTFDQVKTVIELLLGPLVALVSAATGFYFGAQTSRGDDGR
jgi:polyferredoxin